jgi:D-serine deaminase-like pyridoxal phosphate-dependent protein
MLLDLDALEANIKKMADYFKNRTCMLRPHTKTHKSPYIARMQIEAGAIGITCAKAQDAVGFAKAGITSILVANQVVDPIKIEELVGMMEFADITLCLDNMENARMVSAIAEKRGIQIPVLVEVDIGLNRCGLAPGVETLDFVRAILTLKGIRFQGLMGYEGGLFLLDEEEKERVCLRRLGRLIETKALMEESSIEVKEVSSGGSNTYRITGCYPGITDIQVGSYATMDTWNQKHGQDFQLALTVLTTVISRPRPQRAVIDAGLKALSTDHELPRIISHNGVRIEALNEEHGKLSIEEVSKPELKVGDRVELVPSHGCTTIPLYTKYFAMKKERVIAELELISGSAAY